MTDTNMISLSFGHSYELENTLKDAGFSKEFIDSLYVPGQLQIDGTSLQTAFEKIIPDIPWTDHGIFRSVFMSVPDRTIDTEKETEDFAQSLVELKTSLSEITPTDVWLDIHLKELESLPIVDTTPPQEEGVYSEEIQGLSPKGVLQKVVSGTIFVNTDIKTLSSPVPHKLELIPSVQPDLSTQIVVYSDRLPDPSEIFNVFEGSKPPHMNDNQDGYVFDFETAKSPKVTASIVIQKTETGTTLTLKLQSFWAEFTVKDLEII